MRFIALLALVFMVGCTTQQMVGPNTFIIDHDSGTLDGSVEHANQSIATRANKLCPNGYKVLEKWDQDLMGNAVRHYQKVECNT